MHSNVKEKGVLSRKMLIKLTLISTYMMYVPCVCMRSLVHLFIIDDALAQHNNKTIVDPKREGLANAWGVATMGLENVQRCFPNYQCCLWLVHFSRVKVSVHGGTMQDH